MDLTQILILSIVILGILVLFIVCYPLYFSIKEKLRTGGVKKIRSSIPAVRLEPVVNQGIQIINNSEYEKISQQRAMDFNSAGETQAGNSQQTQIPTSIRKTPKFEVFSNIPTATRQGAFVNNYRNWSSNWN